jgi:VWFA-related protein
MIHPHFRWPSALETIVRRSTLISVPFLVLALSVPLRAQQPADKPAASGLQEKVQVKLLQLDAVAMDKQGKTVTDLKAGDFSLKIGTVPLEVSTVDLTCPIGAAPDPGPLEEKPTAPPAPIAPGVKRRVVFAFDYSFLDVTMRPQVLDAAAWMLRMSKTDDEEVMIVALTSEVRVEQRFTKDIRHLVAALGRMKHDVTLWAREYPVGASGRGYFGNLSTLMDVLGSYDGAKAVVLFSQATNADRSGRYLYYNEVAAHAAAVRGAIYPAKPDLLTSGVGDTLTRLANQSGGRMPRFSNDLSLPYRRAQRDLSCRYTIGAYIDPEKVSDPQKSSLTTSRPDVSLRAPEMVELFSEASRQRARVGAAYVDPGPFNRPLVRAFAYSAVPAGADKWDTLVAVSFPAQVGAAGADIDVKAVLRRDNMQVDDYKRRIHVDPAASGEQSRPVTLLGDTRLQDGQYNLTVVLSDPDGGEIVSAQSDFTVPQVPEDLLILRGPIMGRVVPGGLFLRANPKEQAENTRLGKVLGPGNGFEPLLVAEIEAKDKLLFYWSACVLGKSPIGGDALVSRSIRTAKGEVVHALDPVPLKLEDRGKGMFCQDMLETLPPSTLASGEYHLDVAVTHANGDVVSQGTSPLSVK